MMERAGSALVRRIERRNVVQLPPLRRRYASAVSAPALFCVGCRVGRPPPFLSPPIPHDFHCGIVGEGPAEQFERGEMATPYDHESGFGHVGH